ncbi:MAG: C39 family peptidase [Clostridiaceae bacterium]|nr:C39 family peptidase [Clostridiaceae bacterium]
MSKTKIKSLKIICVILIFFFTTACSSPKTDNDVEPVDDQLFEKETIKSIESKSNSAKKYSVKTDIASAPTDISVKNPNGIPEENKTSNHSYPEITEIKGTREKPTPESKSTQTENRILSDSERQVRLEVPIKIQEVWNYCAPTTVSMILDYKGIDIDQYQLATEMGTYEPFGTHNADAIRILNKHLFGYEYPADNEPGYRIATVTNSDLNSEDMHLFKERVIDNINNDFPMYYTFDMSRIYPGKAGEHNVVGTGYELTADGADIAYVYFLDPLASMQDPIHGGLKKVTPQELLYAMLTCEEPNYAW